MRRTPQAVSVERTVDATGSTIRLVLEPLPDRQVLIIEYRRRRSQGERFERLRGEEGKRLPFDLLKLDVDYWQLFPQGGLFD